MNCDNTTIPFIPDPDIAGIGVRNRSSIENLSFVQVATEYLVGHRWIYALGIYDLFARRNSLFLQLPECTESNRSCIYQISDAQSLENFTTTAFA